MTYPQQPGNWNDPSWPSAQPSYEDPAQSASGQPVSDAGYPPSTYPPSAYPAYGYPMVTAPPPTNGMAIAALVLGILGVLGVCGYGIGGYIGVVGAILGHIARRQIRERGESGDGLALAGVITGWISTGIAVLATVGIVILIIIAVNAESTTAAFGY